MASWAAQAMYRRVMLTIGACLAAALLVLLLSPAIALFAGLYGIPKLAAIVLGAQTLAGVLLIVTVPVGWALGFVGLAHAALAHIPAKRKRKAKRKHEWLRSERAGMRTIGERSARLRSGSAAMRSDRESIVSPESGWSQQTDARTEGDAGQR